MLLVCACFQPLRKPAEIEREILQPDHPAESFRRLVVDEVEREIVEAEQAGEEEPGTERKDTQERHEPEKIPRVPHRAQQKEHPEGEEIDPEKPAFFT